MARLSQGQTIAAVGAVALLIAMFLAWAGNGASVNVWKLPGSDLDIYLLITAAVALLLAHVRLSGWGRAQDRGLHRALSS